MWFYKTSDAIHEDIHNKIKVSAYDIFTWESVEKFVTYMALWYVFVFMSFYQSFDLTCEELYSYSNKAMDVVLLRANPELAANINAAVASFFVAGVDTLGNLSSASDAIINKNTATIQDGNKTSSSIPTAQPAYDPGAKYRVTTKTTTTENTTDWSSIIDAIQVHNITSDTGAKTERALTALELYRQRLIAQTVDSSDQIEEWVCSFVVEDIKKKYNNPDFKISVIFMMYLIIRPAMELWLHLISFANWWLFSLMFKFGWFKKYEDREVSENLE